MNTNEAKGKITEAEAVAKYELYVSTMEQLNFRNTSSANFTLDNLKKFIAEAEAQAKTLNINGELGMRVYFGATQSQSSVELTVFLTPTHIEQGEIQNTGRLYLNYATVAGRKPKPKPKSDSDEENCDE
ncbi:MAG: hypothetical protein ACPGEC_00205 [Flavobacteriales bacterium]